VSPLDEADAALTSWASVGDTSIGIDDLDAARRADVRIGAERGGSPRRAACRANVIRRLLGDGLVARLLNGSLYIRLHGLLTSDHASRLGKYPRHQGNRSRRGNYSSCHRCGFRGQEGFAPEN
jgi:hypothetical protein